MNTLPVRHYDRVTLRPLNELASLHEFDITIQVVPGYEADADSGRISEDAPLGRAVLRRSAGEKINLQVHDRKLAMLILAVEKPTDSTG
ncbi:GreA/GreB family elongation factor [Prosthecobacter sp.]|uniref:GreA/GreB family elongation factor n=1 Tax=Prosthecobacter sp. TaxID=1965333 RepID=UPI002488921E|nr:GreA/GreB family elongation factor [Prosthecobacter sp.]MDI1312932.1 GreA/GreB family elongation factor [Prosthecobacter sp.]